MLSNLVRACLVTAVVLVIVAIRSAPRLAQSSARAGLGGSSQLRFPDLRRCGVSDTPLLNSLTVRGVLAVLNEAIDGGNSPYDYEQLAAVAESLTQSFEGGTPSPFAQQHLVSGTCATG
jgi:hypothetical protein